MIIMISGAAALLAGSVSFSLFRYRTTDKTIETFIRSMRTLTPPGRAALKKVCGGPNPSSQGDLDLSLEDILTVFANSRLNVRIANRARQCEPEDKELAAIFQVLQEKHAELRWRIFLLAIESIIGKLRLGQSVYPRMLLWTYGDELELLGQISEKCGPLEGNAIRAIL
jgi:hypothetical protein